MYRVTVVLISILGCAFVLSLGMQLPASVASHFSALGKPDHFMSRGAFVALMCLLTSGVPLLTWWLQAHAAAHGSAKIPNANYWFSAEQRERTERYLRGRATCLSILMTTFFCYVFWLVALANTREGGATALPMNWLWAGLATFVLGIAVSVGAMYVRFRRGAAQPGSQPDAAR
jgi:uncharacterized membrane protein